jgi:hypothetical protein
MKKSQTEYHRVLSDEEVHEGRIMIMQDAVKFFPKPFKAFTVTAGGKKFQLAVEAVDCRCRGEAEPHQHFWLPLKEAKTTLKWERRAHVAVVKVKDGEFSLESR